MGPGPILCAQAGIGRPVDVGRSEAHEGPAVRKSSDFRNYRSVVVAPVVRWRSVVRGLGGVGRPVSVGRPVTVDLVGRTLGLAGVPGVGRPV